MPRICVIIPVYNVEKYLRRCVDSILAQTYSDFELILVDDGSTDSCGAISNEYAKKDSRVKVIHQENRGVAVARNVGLDLAFEVREAQWIAFVDSDDWVHPQYLEILLQAANESGKAISMCRFAKTEVETEFENQELALKIVSPGEAYTYNTRFIDAYPWGRLYAKECFNTIRYPSGKTFEDLATTYKLLYAQDQIAIAENTLYYYYNRDDSIVRIKWHKGKLDHLEAYENQIPFLDKKGEVFVATRLKEAYISNILGHYGQAQVSEYPDEEKKAICAELRKKMRKALKNYGKSAAASVKDTPWYYEMAYPKLMYVYWIFKAQLDKLKRK